VEGLEPTNVRTPDNSRGVFREFTPEIESHRNPESSGASENLCGFVWSLTTLLLPNKHGSKRSGPTRAMRLNNEYALPVLRRQEQPQFETLRAPLPRSISVT